VFCRHCGALVGLGNPHSCAKDPGPRPLRAAPADLVRLWWLAAAGLLLLLTGALVISVWALVDVLRVHLAAKAALAGGEWFTTDPLLHTVVQLSGWMIGVGLACLVAQLLWKGWTRRVLERAGDRGRAHFDHWTSLAGRVAALYFLLAATRSAVQGPNPDGPLIEVADKALTDTLFLLPGVAAAVLMLVTAVVTLRRTGAFLRPVPVP
jgi:hypothetical protein